MASCASKPPQTQPSCLFASTRYHTLRTPLATTVSVLTESMYTGVPGNNAVTFLLRNNEHGLPAFPFYSLVEGRWVERPTVRPITVA